MIHHGIVTAALAGRRLDDVLRELFPQLSKGRIRKVIDWGGCRVNGAVVRVASRGLHPGDAVVVGVTDEEAFREYALAPDALRLDDPEYLAIDKPAGVYCQRTPYQLKGTVELAVGAWLKSSGSTEPARIVHRLDRGTSGVMVFPKTREAAAHLSKALEAGSVEKVYWALAAGCPAKAAWTVEAPIAELGKSLFAVRDDGRAASSSFKRLGCGRDAAGAEIALVEARPHTGRTHQIRLHLLHAGHPVLGDDRYGGPPSTRMMLHCRSMAFIAADGRRVEATAPPDARFAAACAACAIALP
ncbi:MAG TPA: RluA family pseudouridine synthase [Candidatus Deferrimicrobiaceae bacterium]